MMDKQKKCGNLKKTFLNPEQLCSTKVAYKVLDIEDIFAQKQKEILKSHKKLR